MRKLLIALVLFGGVFWLVSNNSRTTEEQPPAQDQQQTEQQAASESETMGTSTDEASAALYNYTTQRGDSYTEMARKAMQTYAKQHSANITQAGIIFAETNLTKSAGSPRLEVGQEIKFAEETLKEWAEKAQVLTAAQQAAWNRYVSSVNFDTSSVGVAR